MAGPSGNFELCPIAPDSNSDTVTIDGFDDPEEIPLLAKLGKIEVDKTPATSLLDDIPAVNDKKLLPKLENHDPRIIESTQNIVTNLFNAIQDNNIQEINRLLEEDESLVDSILNTNHYSLMHQAAMSGHTEVLKTLLKHRATTDTLDNEGMTPLHTAVCFGHEDIVKELVNEVPTLTEKYARKCVEESTGTFEDDCEGKNEQLLLDTSPLHLACMKIFLPCAKLLMQAGMDPNVLNEQGLTPLDVSGDNINIDSLGEYGRKKLATQYLQLLEFLISNGAKPSTKQDVIYAQTPMHVAVHLGSVGAVRKLIEVGYDKPLNNRLGYTAVHLAVRERSEEIFDVLTTEYGKPGLESKNNKGETPLHIAVDVQWLLGVKMLLEDDANVTEKTRKGKTPLHLAASNLNHAILKELLNNQRSKEIINDRDNSGNLPLFLSIVAKKATNSSMNLKCVSQFLNKNAATHLLDSKGRTVLHCVAETKQQKILEALFKHDNEGMISIINATTTKGETALHIAAMKNDPKSCESLLRPNRGCDIRAVTNCGESAFSLAFDKEHWEILKIILKKDASFANKPTTCSDGRNPIHKACIDRQSKVITVLVDAGCDLSAKCTIEGVEWSALDLLIHRLPHSVDLLEKSLNASITVKKTYIDIDYKILLSGMQDNDNIQLKVVDALVQTGDQVNQKMLFMHALVESFLFLQWKRICKFYYLTITAYILFAIPFSILVVIFHSYKDEELSKQPMNTIIIFLRISIFVSSIFHIPHRLLYVYHKTTKSKYFFKPELSQAVVSFNIFSILRVVKIVFMVVVIFVATVDPKKISRELASVAILVCWVEFMWLASKVPKYGFYMLMFFEVTSNFFIVLVSFSFLIIGFVISFTIEFQSQEPFTTVPDGFLRAMVMMTNEFDYNDLFNKFPDDRFALVFTKIVFFLFLLLVGVVTMNIILAKAISDVKKDDRLRKQAAFLVTYEQFLGGLGIKNKPIEQKFKLHFDKAYLFPERLTHTILERAYIVNRATKEEYKLLQKRHLTSKSSVATNC